MKYHFFVGGAGGRGKTLSALLWLCALKQATRRLLILDINTNNSNSWDILKYTCQIGVLGPSPNGIIACCMDDGNWLAKKQNQDPYNLTEMSKLINDAVDIVVANGFIPQDVIIDTALPFASFANIPDDFVLTGTDVKVTMFFTWTFPSLLDEEHTLLELEQISKSNHRIPDTLKNMETANATLKSRLGFNDANLFHVLNYDALTRLKGVVTSRHFQKLMKINSVGSVGLSYFTEKVSLILKKQHTATLSPASLVDSMCRFILDDQTKRPTNIICIPYHANLEDYTTKWLAKTNRIQKLDDLRHKNKLHPLWASVVVNQLKSLVD
ncbi:MAG: hypothetical protein H6673_15640 [Anaerolineales bacterium]|nr:hypothetical protein [Anaerolineales bacterium]